MTPVSSNEPSDLLLAVMFEADTLVRVDLADAIVSAGWRPPPRVIEDVAELDALPELSIVLASKGIGWQMTDRDYDGSAIWEAGTSGETSAALLAGGPVTVLWEPEEASQ